MFLLSIDAALGNMTSERVRALMALSMSPIKTKSRQANISLAPHQTAPRTKRDAHIFFKFFFYAHLPEQDLF